MYFAFIIVTAFSGLLLATIIRIELSLPGVSYLNSNAEQYLTIVAVHALVMVFFVVIPALFGAFGNFLLPTQLGVRDVAFPRLNSFMFWVTPAGFVLLLHIFFFDKNSSKIFVTAFDNSAHKKQLKLLEYVDVYLYNNKLIYFFNDVVMFKGGNNIVVFFELCKTIYYYFVSYLLMIYNSSTSIICYVKPNYTNDLAKIHYSNDSRLNKITDSFISFKNSNDLNTTVTTQLNPTLTTDKQIQQIGELFVYFSYYNSRGFYRFNDLCHATNRNNFVSFFLYHTQQHIQNCYN